MFLKPPNFCQIDLRVIVNKLIRPVLVWVGVSGLVFFCILQSELLLLPEQWEPIGRVLYKLAFLFIMPARVVVLPFSPRVNHHWSLTHFAMACVLAPLIWVIFYKCSRFVSTKIFTRIPSDPVHPWEEEGIIPRREFLARSAAGLTFAAATGAGGYASFVEPGQLVIRNYEIPIRGLPEQFDGFRLAHVSDTHYGPFTDLIAIKDMIQVVNQCSPDLVVLTGDYVHFTPASIEKGIRVLTNFRSRFGALAVLGNHEHWEGVTRCLEVFEEIGVPVLNNSRVFLTFSGFSPEFVKDSCICIGGLADLWEDSVSVEKTLTGVPKECPRLLLSHNPDAAELIPPLFRVDLMLSGHTHGGQVRIPFVSVANRVSQYGEKYLGGLCQVPHFPVIVSRGFGTAMFPIRFNVPPEVGIITLRCKA